LTSKTTLRYLAHSEFQLKSTDMKLLPSLREGLLRHPLGDQVLVYDTKRNKVHLLDQATAGVVDSLERGETPEAIAAKLDQRTGSSSGEDMLLLALDELAQAELIEGGVQKAEPMPELTRREILRRFAAIGTAALVPVVLTLTPNTALGQGSLACGAACTTTVSCPGTTRPTCHCCKIGGNTAGTCSTELSGNCQAI
jgi:hypothetical protein